MTTTDNTAPEAVRTASREEIAAKVRGVLAARQIDQATVAAALGKSQAAVSDRLRAVTHFRVDELQIVAHLAGVDFLELVEPPA